MLQRRLGFWDVFCIAAGAMISSGLFVLPSLAYAQAGAASLLAYGVAALLMVPAMLSQAELATAMPKTGGSYVFIERSMGPLPGLMAGAANWFSLALKSAFALVGIGAFARLIWPEAAWADSEWTLRAIAVAFCVGFTALNLVSVKSVGRFQVVMVAGLLAVMVLFVVVGAPAARAEHFRGIKSAGPVTVLATAAFVFISYGGITGIASVAGEVIHPGRNIPRGMLAAAAVVSLLYVGAVGVTIGVLGPDGLLDADGRANLTPLSSAAGAFLGPTGVVLLSGAAMLAFFTTANGGILSASRSPIAMSHDQLVPGVFRRVSKRFGTPYVGVLATSAFMVAIISLLSVADLVKVASTMMLLLFAMVCGSVLVMRGSGLENYRPLFRAWGYPWTQVGGVIIYAALIAEMIWKMGWAPLITLAAFVLACGVWHVLYIRPRLSRESALLVLVRRLVGREMARPQLEHELRELAFQRDDIVHDRFDRLVQDAPVLDLSGATMASDLFDRIGEVLSERVGSDARRLAETFRRREDETSTVLQPGLAVPHVVVEGEDIFELLLVRSRGGIIFPSDDRHPVHVAFVLAASPDRRNDHLKALMAIAHVVQEHHFMRRWQQASDEQGLRDVILLSSRRRGD